MTLNELVGILKGTGYPLAYSHFNESVDPPFIAYLVSYSPHFHADNKTYHKIDSVDIELYTKKKDLEVEKVLEDLLDANELPYEPFETFIESERLFQKTYEVRLY